MRSVVRVLDRNVKLWHLLVVGLLVAVVAGGSVGIAAGPAALFPSGSTRIVSVSATEPVSVGSNVNTRVLRATFTVPSGKTADAQASFSGFVVRNVGANAYCYGEFALDSAPASSPPSDPTFKPGVFQLVGWADATTPTGLTASMTGFRRNIGAGTHNLDVILRGSFAGCAIAERALNVLVQIH